MDICEPILSELIDFYCFEEVKVSRIEDLEFHRLAVDQIS